MSQMEKTTEEVNKIDITVILIDFLRALRRMWPAVVVFTLIGAVLMGVREERSYVPYYTASATFTIKAREEQQDATTSANYYYDNSAAEQMATTFPHILTSGVLQRRVASELGTASVPGRISASAVAGTNLLTLSVRDTNPQRAYTTLQAVIENYPSFSEVIVGKVNMNILDETGVPESPDNPKDITDSVKKGALLGAGVACAWAGLVTLLRRTIRREEDFGRLINQRCLGTIPYVPQKSRSVQVERRINILDETANHEFKEAVRMIRNKIERSAKENGLKTFLITSALPGEGKSTIAVNLALSIAQEGKRVALVDCDLRNPSDGTILGVNPEKGFVDYLSGEAPINECMFNSQMLRIGDGFKFVFVPGGSAIEDGTKYLGSERMRAVVQSLREYADYVILDSAPVGILTDASVLAQYADGAVFIVKKDFAKADLILSGMEHLSQGNLNMVGCILNGH